MLEPDKTERYIGRLIALEQWCHDLRIVVSQGSLYVDESLTEDFGRLTADVWLEIADREI